METRKITGEHPHHVIIRLSPSRLLLFRRKPKIMVIFVNELCVSFSSLPKERPRVPLYSDRGIQASQGEPPKHTRKGRDKVDEHEGTDEENSKRETKLTNTEKQRRGRQQVRKSKERETRESRYEGQSPRVQVTKRKKMTL